MKRELEETEISVSETGTEHPKTLAAGNIGGGEYEVFTLNSRGTVLGSLDLPWRELVSWAERVTADARDRYHEHPAPRLIREDGIDLGEITGVTWHDGSVHGNPENWDVYKVQVRKEP